MNPVSRAVAGLRGRVASTPGPLRLISVDVAVLPLPLLLWLASFATIVARQQAVGTVSDDAGPSFVAAGRIHADLSEADATVARAFLAGGVEPADQREVYERTLASATEHVIDLAGAGGPYEVRQSLAVLAREEMVLAGLAAQDPRTKVVGATVFNQQVAAGVSKDSPELTAFVNGVLERAFADRSWADIHDRWLRDLREAPAPPIPVYRK